MHLLAKRFHFRTCSLVGNVDAIREADSKNILAQSKKKTKKQHGYRVTSVKLTSR